MKLQHIGSNNSFINAEKIEIPEIFYRRVFTGKEDLDYMLGGSGLLPGSTFTMAAAPGTGKSTILLQIGEILALKDKRVGYISGEESKEQLAFTCRRIGVNKVRIANMTNIEDIVEAIKREKFDFCVLDSLPTLTTTEPMNSREKEQHISNLLVSVAKQTECIVGVVMHFTKGGSYKGTTILPHACDLNMIMRLNEEDPSIRDIEITKNRFGFAGQSSFVMNGNGFDFIKVESSASMETMGKRDKKPSKKDEVLAFITEKGKVTQNEIITLVGSVQYVNNITKELMLTGKINKEGKGGEAVYSVVSK